MKLAIVISHPIQYLVPFFQLLAREATIDLTVFYTWDFGVKATYDEEFKRNVKWDIPLLDGYKYIFLKNYSLKPYSNFFGQVNPGIIGKMRKGQFDAVLLHGWNSFTNWLAFFTAIFSNTNILLRGESPLNQELLKPRWKRLLKKFLFKTFFQKVSTFLYIGEENRKFYRYYGVQADRLLFIPYAVDNERFINAATILKLQREKLRKKYDIPQKSPTILFTGKLIPKKHPMDLLKAFEKLVSNNKTLIHPTLLFVGDGSLRPELERYVAEHILKQVYFIGFKNQTELPEFYAIADVFVLPSQAGETWGLVVNEAMCFGLPVVVSDIVGCAVDLVESDRNGFIFPVGNIEKLSELLNILVMDAQKRKKFGAKSLEIVEHYTYKRGVEAIVALLDQ